MRFKGSNFEERYTNYWNTQVVKTDRKIRTLLKNSIIDVLFKADEQLGVLLKTYHSQVTNIVKNLQRQSYMFSDQVYLNTYLKETVRQALQDAASYDQFSPSCKALNVDFIKYLNAQFEFKFRPNKRVIPANEESAACEDIAPIIKM